MHTVYVEVIALASTMGALISNDLVIMIGGLSTTRLARILELNQESFIAIGSNGTAHNSQ